MARSSGRSPIRTQRITFRNNRILNRLENIAHFALVEPNVPDDIAFDCPVPFRRQKHGNNYGSRVIILLFALAIVWG
jgi:hypothetical protein